MGTSNQINQIGSSLSLALLLTFIPSGAHSDQSVFYQSTPNSSVSVLADDTYERICLVLGWTDCAEWRILDEAGTERNRVIGPYPESALRAICGSNLCGGGPGGTVELIRIIPKEVLPVIDYGPGPKPVDNTQSSESPTEGSNGPSNPETQAPSDPTPRLGGYAVVHPQTRHVCGVIVATMPQVMSSEYMGCPAGSQTYFQTRPSETGNVAGYHGKDVTFYDGVFYLSWGSIVDGIATDRNGRVWDTGTGQVLNEGSQAPSNSSGSPESTNSQAITSSPQTGSQQASQSPESESSTAQIAPISQSEESSPAQSALNGKTVVGSFLGRWAVRFENLAGSTISIRAGGNWHKFTLSSDNQLFSRRSVPGSDVKIQIWVDGSRFAEASVLVR
jgi:hypothetical protein